MLSQPGSVEGKNSGFLRTGLPGLAGQRCCGPMGFKVVQDPKPSNPKGPINPKPFTGQRGSAQGAAAQGFASGACVFGLGFGV